MLLAFKDNDRIKNCLQVYEPGVGWKEPPGWDCDHCLRMNLFILNLIVAGQCTENDNNGCNKYSDLSSSST